MSVAQDVKMIRFLLRESEKALEVSMRAPGTPRGIVRRFSSLSRLQALLDEERKIVRRMVAS